MATFTWVPEWQARKKKKPEMFSLPFGDGYTQRIAQGANVLREEYTLTFRGDYSRIKEIDEFLDSQLGYASFQWITPDGADKQFYCEEWETDFSEYANNSLSATFKQR